MNPDVIVVGAGLAGASTAWHLARAGLRVLLLEKETLAGTHSSGRNAAILRQAVADPEIALLARESALFLAAPGEGWPAEGLVRRTGLLLLDRAGPGGETRLQPIAGAARRSGLPLEEADPAAACPDYPWIAEARADLALLSREDGVVDVHALLEGYLRGARALGAAVRTGVEVTGFERAGGAVAGVRLSGGAAAAGGERVPCGAVVLAAGAWCEGLGRLAGAIPFPMVPKRRHLFLSEPAEAPPGPVVWHLSPEVYLRPEVGSWLLSPCDEEPQPPGDPPISADAETLLARKVLDAFPSLGALRIRTRWAGLRTLTPDGRFVLGPDPEVRGLFWAGGLGGHGVTVCHAAGRIVAASVLGAAVPLPFSAGRRLPPEPAR